MCVPNPWLFELVAVAKYLDDVGGELAPVGTCALGCLAPACIDGSHEMHHGAGFFTPDPAPGVSVQCRIVVSMLWVTLLTGAPLGDLLGIH